MKVHLTTKPGLEEEWQKSVDINQDPYGFAVINVVARVGQGLDMGKTPAHAEHYGIKGSGITGYQAGVMASMIAHFHPRGDEFNKYWNKQFGVEDAEGTVNPAIVTVKGGEDGSTGL